MNVVDEILQRLNSMPPEKQGQVLAYISGLGSGRDLLDDPEAWSQYSLALACEGIEDDGPEYALDDIVERYS
jgi:hypothetical protein